MKHIITLVAVAFALTLGACCTAHKSSCSTKKAGCCDTAKKGCCKK